MSDKPLYRTQKAPRVSNNAFKDEKVWLPKKTSELLREIAYDLQVPMSRLIAIAVDNELDQTPAFRYPCEMPTSKYNEYQYAEEAQRLFDFLKSFPSGTGIDTLMLCRRDMGIESRSTLMCAYRELLERGVIEMFKPKNSQYYKAKDYQRVRVVGFSKKELLQKKYKKIEGESTRYQRPITDDDIEREDET